MGRKGKQKPKVKAGQYAVITWSDACSVDEQHPPNIERQLMDWTSCGIIYSVGVDCVTLVRDVCYSQKEEIEALQGEILIPISIIKHVKILR